MQIKDQVCSLSQALILKELGVEQKSVFYWHEHDLISVNHITSDIGIASAFTVAELGQMIPDKLNYKGVDCYVSFQQSGVFYYCCIRTHDHRNIDLLQTYGYTEAIARAQLIIAAIQEGISELSIQTINHSIKTP